MLKTRVVILSVAFLVIFILTAGLFAARTNANEKQAAVKAVSPKFLASAQNYHWNDGRQSAKMLAPAQSFNLNDGRQPAKMLAPAQNFHLNDGRQPAKVLTLTPAQNFHWNDGRQPPKQ